MFTGGWYRVKNMTTEGVCGNAFGFTIPTAHGDVKNDNTTMRGFVEGYEGVLNLAACRLESATGLYEVSISHGAVAPKHPVRPTILAIANNTQAQPTLPWTEDHFSTLFGISDFFMNRYSSGSQFLSQKSLTVSSCEHYLQYEEIGNTSCSSFTDSWQSTLDLLNELMSRLGVDAAQSYDASKLLGDMDPGMEIY
ncbi:uncharacterized protein LTR77_001783 [Saxophila tyrrhenica]|uniref:Uncharacterized protein n=1 Tax=Saxophila tyrrhenica TaxID=1690608 RepID=A0AAV9PPK0_9PEZI|nr:hypothetical protein LTR77_001783 [Saxophila tyrrhenica]